MFMYNFNGYKYALVLIDPFSSRAFARPLKSKHSSTCKDALISIFNEAKSTPSKLNTDAGKEFVSLKSWFKSKKIYFKEKGGANKVRNLFNNLK